MKLWEAAVLGLLQGLGEFLPISSSGHLKLAEYFFGLRNAEEMLAFDVLLHLATLIAVVLFFWQDLKQILVALARSVPRVAGGGLRALEADPAARVAWLVLATMIPTGLVVLLLRKVEKSLADCIWLVAVTLLVAGALNWCSHRMTVRGGGVGRIEQLTWRQALWCGLAQGLAAIFHGMSRSGATIAAGLACGLGADAAPRFSFLMLIPAVTAAAILELPKLAKSGQVPGGAMLVGFAVAAVTGYLAVGAVVRLVREGRMRYFAYYCWTVGLLALVLLALGVGHHPA